MIFCVICCMIIIFYYCQSHKPVISNFTFLITFHQLIKTLSAYRISKLDMISINSDLLDSESIIIMPVLCTSYRVIRRRKAVHLANSQLLYIGSSAIDVLGVFLSRGVVYRLRRSVDTDFSTDFLRFLKTILCRIVIAFRWSSKNDPMQDRNSLSVEFSKRSQIGS